MGIAAGCVALASLSPSIVWRAPLYRRTACGAGPSAAAARPCRIRSVPNAPALGVGRPASHVRHCQASESSEVHPSATSSSVPKASSGAPAGGRSSTQAASPVALAAALTALGAPLYVWLSAQPALPPVEEVAGALAAGAAVVAAGVPAGLLAAKVAMGDQFHVELHRGRLYVCAGVPSRGPPLAPGSVAVRPTGDARGNGAYASLRIPAGTHIADYSGHLLDRAAFAQRYPDAVGDYAMAVDADWVMDAAAAAPDTSTFHPVHMNHSRVRPNVRRFYRRSERRVSFFAAADIEPGQELLYDYGRAYWYGREHLELP